MLSLVFHPILTGAYVLLLAGAAGGTSFIAGLWWSLLTIAVTSGIPAVDLALRLRAGSVSSIDVVLRTQRTRPLLITLVCSLLALAMVVALDGPGTLAVALVAALLSGLVLTAITRRWKISFHAAVLSGGIAILAWAVGPAMFLAIPLLGAVGWARVVLGRHSITQVVAGAAVGGSICAAVVLVVGPPAT